MYGDIPMSYEEAQQYTEFNFYNALDLELRERKGREHISQAEVLKEIRRVWELKLYDQLGFIITRERFCNIKTSKTNKFTYHHLRVPGLKGKGGPSTIHNGSALLMYTGHPFLHDIQNVDPELYEDLIKLLIEINEQFHHPTPKQLLRSNEIFCTFERSYSAAENSKGKPLIKPEYTLRLNHKNISKYYGK